MLLIAKGTWYYYYTHLTDDEIEDQKKLNDLL